MRVNADLSQYPFRTSHSLDAPIMRETYAAGRPVLHHYAMSYLASDIMGTARQAPVEYHSGANTNSAQQINDARVIPPSEEFRDGQAIRVILNGNTKFS